MHKYLKTGNTSYCLKYLPISRKKVVFDNFFGKGYGENPKYIAEEINRQGLKWDMVWLLKDMSYELPPYLRAVQYGSEQAKYELATAKVVVNNVRNSMRVKKKKGQIYLQTWHGGIGYKQVERAVEKKLSLSYVQAAKRDGAECDAIISACAYQTEDFTQNFWLDRNAEILEIGQPRCDALFKANNSEIEKKVRTALQIPATIKIVLYAPTFRDDGSFEGYTLDYKRVIKAFEQHYGQPCVLVVRLHPNAYKLQELISYDDKILNGSKYPDIQELYHAASVLITDYSSTAFDFALLEKPIFICALDFEKYIKLRGEMTDIYHMSPFPKSYTNEELIDTIHNFSEEEYKDALKRFREDVWKPYDSGHASEKTVNWLKNQMRMR